MEDSVFTKIIKGDIPSHKIYEDDRVIAFLDIDPLTPGHTLVVPKKQVDHLWDLSDDDYHYLMSVAKHIAQHMKEVIGSPRVGMAVDGYAVPHVHVHLFPLYKGMEHTISDHIAADKKEPDHAALAEMASKLSL